MAEFTKRIYNFSDFAGDAIKLGKKIPLILRSLFNGKVDADFRERVMLAVTTVNDCRYCTFVHTNLARAYKVSDEEISQIMGRTDCSHCPEEHLAAIRFAYHYAQTEKSPSQAELDSLVEYYGKEKSEQIIAFLDLIYFSNLSGNTFDAFMSRLKGGKAPGSKLLFELPLALALAPVLLPQTAYLKLRSLLANSRLTQ